MSKYFLVEEKIIKANKNQQLSKEIIKKISRGARPKVKPNMF